MDGRKGNGNPFGAGESRALGFGSGLVLRRMDSSGGNIPSSMIPRSGSDQERRD